MQNDELFDIGNVLTKQKLLKLREVYEFCKNINGKSEANDALNRKFVQIVETATRHIHDFAAGKLAVEADAAELMRDYIYEFGREYSVVNGKYVYDYTPDALKAKLKLEQLKYRQKETSNAESAGPETLKKETKPAVVMPRAEKKETGFVIVKPVREQIKAKTVKNENSFSRQEKKETGFVIVKPVREQGKSETAKNKSPRKAAKSSLLMRWGKFLKSTAKTALNVSVQAVKTGYNKIGMLWKQAKNIAGRVFSSAKENIQSFGKRYALAALTLFSSVGASNTYSNSDTVSRRALFNEYLASVRMKTSARNVKFNQPKQAAIFAEDSVYAGKTAPFNVLANTDEEIYANSDDNFEIWNEALNQWRVNFEQPEEEQGEEQAATVTDKKWQDYIYTVEDVKAFEPTASGLEISEQAWNVAENMNSEGYCYRAVKRMFAKADKGMLHGRSAYMAEHYLDNNPFYKKINCGYDAVPYLPDGSCVVLKQNRRHIHGHIFIVGHDKNGRVKDLSSKVRNVMRKMRDYGGLRVYIPADTRIPEAVIERRNQCKILMPDEQVKQYIPVAGMMYKSATEANVRNS